MFSNILCSLLILQLVIFSSAENSHGALFESSTEQDSVKSESFDKLEELVKTDREAYLLWNITNRYRTNTLIGVDIKGTCLSELQKDNKLIPFYVVNLTLEQNQVLMSSYIGSHFWRFESKPVSRVKALYEKRIKLVSDQEIYLCTVQNMIEDLLHKGDSNMCVTNSFCGCISKQELDFYISQFPRYKEDTDKVWEFMVFRSYVELFFRIILIIMGMVLNCTVLFIFIKEKSIRTESNILIFSLIISNIIMLLVYIPSDYIKRYESMYDGHEFTAIEVLSVSVNALTILFLNIQRYYEVSRVLNNNEHGCVSRPAYRCIIYLAVLWTWSIVVAIFLGTIDDWSGIAFKALLYFLIYTFVFSIVLSIFNSLTARKLHRAAKEGKTSTEFEHILGSGVVLCLTVVYYSTHIPFYIFRIFEMTMNNEIFLPLTFRLITFCLHLAFFSYSWINIIILYKASGAYRNLLNKYLFRCWYNPGESKYVTMSSVRNIEPEV